MLRSGVRSAVALGLVSFALGCGTVSESGQPDSGSDTSNGNGSNGSPDASDGGNGSSGDAGISADARDPDAGAIACDDGWTGPDCDVCLVHVDGTDGQGGRSARTWDTAVATVQAGIEVARARQISDEVEDCEVWVRAGTYLAGTARTDSFEMAPGVHLYGGFAGGETARSERDWEVHETLLSGDLAQNDDPDDEATFNDNVFTVVLGSDNATLDGFTVTASTSDFDGSGTHRGGGMVNDAASPTIRNVTFYRNHAESGGGMANSNGSHPSLTSVTFLENEATRQGLDGSGGGMTNHGGSSPTLLDVHFIRNIAQTGRGGGMFNNGSSPELTDVTFTENRAENGGAVASQSSSNPSFYNVTFTENEATNSGGAMENRSNVAPVITNSTFSRNRAGSSGGAISSAFASVTVINSIFVGNEAEGSGGAHYSDAGVELNVVSSLFVGNHAGSDGGAFLNRQTSNSPTITTLTNVTLYGNTADSRGGAIHNLSGAGADLRIRNAILWENTAPEEVVIGNAAGTSISHSIVQGGQPAGVANDDWIQSSGANPLFVEAPTNLRLLPSSPGVDAGNSQLAVLEDVDEDLDGNPRVVDGGSGSAIIDLGPYELQ
jgi:predicted outer membrane repeat protein